MPEELSGEGVIVSDGERYLSVERAAEYLGRRRSTIFGYVARYGLHTYRFATTGKRVFFRQSDLDALRVMRLPDDDAPKTDPVAA